MNRDLKCMQSEDKLRIRLLNFVFPNLINILKTYMTLPMMSCETQESLKIPQ